jgi:hypothetical protein
MRIIRNSMALWGTNTNPDRKLLHDIQTLYTVSRQIKFWFEHGGKEVFTIFGNAAEANLPRELDYLAQSIEACNKMDATITQRNLTDVDTPIREEHTIAAEYKVISGIYTNLSSMFEDEEAKSRGLGMMKNRRTKPELRTKIRFLVNTMQFVNKLIKREDKKMIIYEKKMTNLFSKIR